MFFETAPHRVWAEIDLDSLVYNYRLVRDAAGGAQLLCVIKADAYGHGAVAVAKALAATGAERFAVATPEEALRLRRNGVQGGILLLDTVPARWAPVMAENGIAMAVASTAVAAAYAGALGGARLVVHIKVNTGMNRLGIDEPNAVEEALAIAAQPGFEVEGLFTHYPSADEPEADAFTRGQTERFLAIADALAKRGLRPPLCHCCNSGGILAHPYGYANMVRPGIVLYGSNPRPQSGWALRPVMALRCGVVQLRRVPRGVAVSYGLTWTAQRDSLIATLPVGYADGLPRVASGRLEMLVRGMRAPQVGRICMDMCMLDVTDVPGVAEGDIVTVFGGDGDACLPVDELAERAGTISYEVLCAIAARVPRLYFRAGRPVEEICYLDRL